MTEPDLHPCPICKGSVRYQRGYYHDQTWVWPYIRCDTRNCGLKYQPIVYPDRGEIFERWNSQYPAEEPCAVRPITMEYAEEVAERRFCKGKCKDKAEWEKVVMNVYRWMLEGGQSCL